MKSGEGFCREPHGSALNPWLPQRMSTGLVSGIKWPFLRHRFSRAFGSIWHLNNRTGVEASSSGAFPRPQSRLYYATTAIGTAKFRHLRKGDCVLIVCSCCCWRRERPSVENFKVFQEVMWLPAPLSLPPTTNNSSKTFPWSHYPCLCLSTSHP